MDGVTGESRSGWLRGPLRPLRHRQYQLLAGALTMSLLAAGVWLIAVVWQVIALGGGPGQLSFVSAAMAAGMLATTLLGGVLADRIPQCRILLAVAGARTVAVGLVAVLALADQLRLWQLAAVALLIGVGNGFHYPAYSALLPSILPPDDLMAANGVEGMLRPMIMQAAGPALASLLIAAWSPGAALLVVTVLELAGLLFLLALRPVPLRHEQTAPGAHPIRSTLTDLRDGFVYMGRTPWLLATLLYASVLILLIMGPIEVLVPFVIKDQAGGGPGDHALVMAAFGIGGAIGSLGMAAFRMPRRYLTIMNLFWGLGCLPLAVVGVAGRVWPIAVAVFVVGICFSAPMVIWGTLLQRRVPPHMLGRVSSLDFFVSLVFMPLSMAIAGPVSAGIGLGPTFALAGLLPAALAVLAIVLARMPQDELAHPLDVPPETAGPAEPAGPAGPTERAGPAGPTDENAATVGPEAPVRV
ncbi:MFS transporter [Micromonospora sp. WMMD1102]|uniref:MFS transporter n=1 Tax=Micromonospora sp. WMMD1102 TaxID=3016105 RepID=UPI00241502E8|nr:MFS transporter [Micromonospora sp. WMMD1102]MDG4786613.1 MFS transporter [Micromonospora sp. WMMD1102]